MAAMTIFIQRSIVFKSNNSAIATGKDRAYLMREVPMKGRQIIKNAATGVAATAAIAAAGYAALVVFNRAKYGKVKGCADGAKDSLLDQFIPEPEIADHHEIDVKAPADVVMATAKEMEFLKSPVVSAIFKARELALGGEPDMRKHPTALLDQMQSIGWVILAERPGREIVLGAVTQPWQAAPVFRSVPAGEFRDFAEPGYVKIAWTLAADPIDAERSIFHTETRASTTDADARRRFRRYWSFVAPGVEIIRMAMLAPLRSAAEERVRRPAA
jgi:hypothetical protein